MWFGCKNLDGLSFISIFFFAVQCTAVGVIRQSFFFALIFFLADLMFNDRGFVFRMLSFDSILEKIVTLNLNAFRFLDFMHEI